jgi:hypothetical protein
MQATSDRFLGATTGPSGRHFYVRQLRDMKVSAEVETFNANLLTATAPCADRCSPAPTPRAAASQCRSAPTWAKAAAFTEAMVAYAKGYANQVERDYSAFREACRAGRVTAQTEADFAADFSP